MFFVPPVNLYETAGFSARYSPRLHLAITAGQHGKDLHTPLSLLLALCKKINPIKVKQVGEETFLKKLAQKVKVVSCGQGKFEFQFTTGENLMTGKENKNVFGVLENFINSVADENSSWIYLNTRLAVESETEFSSPRARLGNGAVNAFIELRGKLQMRSVVTLDASLAHARLMLHGVTPTKGLSQTQLDELSKTGLLQDGTLDPVAFKVVLGKMRNELRAMPQSAGKTEQIDQYLEVVCHSMWLGLVNNGRYSQSFETFKKWVQLDKVKNVDAWIEQNPKLKTASDDALLHGWNHRD